MTGYDAYCHRHHPRCPAGNGDVDLECCCDILTEDDRLDADEARYERWRDA